MKKTPGFAVSKSLILALMFFISTTWLAGQESPVKTHDHDWLNKIASAKERLAGLKLEHGKKIARYKEVRKPSTNRNKRKIKKVRTRYYDFAWKEIGLAIMGVESEHIDLIKITKRGDKLVNWDNRFVVLIERRVSGINWNGKNTAYRVFRQSNDEQYIVLANKWLGAPTKAGNKPAREDIYVPYSTALHQESLVEKGDGHLREDIDVALYRLGRSGVGSLVFDQKTIATTTPIDFVKNICLAEHTDPQEFYAFTAGTVEYDPFDRVKVIIAANGEAAYNDTASSARALGLMQFTNQTGKNRRGKQRLGTWDLVRKEYREAELPEFQVGATDHVNSMQATALLRDYNLNRLVKTLGEEILADENLEAYLYAAHNCGIDRVIKALRRAGPGQNWRSALRKLGKTDETIIYLEKIDYLLSKDSDHP